MIDIVELKKAVQEEKIKFYIMLGNIFCKDLETGEVVLVGEAQWI